MRPELTPFSAARLMISKNEINLGILIVYLDFVLNKDEFHTEILEFLGETREEIKKYIIEDSIFKKGS